MDDPLLLGLWRHLIPIPPAIWHRQVSQRDRLGFMTEAHHRVRNFVVREMPRLGQPMTPGYLAEALGLPRAQVVTILDDLEKRMTFVFRNPAGAVTWAYPVTVEVTPHRLRLSSGETAFAA